MPVYFVILIILFSITASHAEYNQEETQAPEDIPLSSIFSSVVNFLPDLYTTYRSMIDGPNQEAFRTGLEEIAGGLQGNATGNQQCTDCRVSKPNATLEASLSNIIQQNVAETQMES